MTGIRHRLCLALACGTLCAPLQAQSPALAAADRAAILQAAGATQRAGRWVICTRIRTPAARRSTACATSTAMAAPRRW